MSFTPEEQRIKNMFESLYREAMDDKDKMLSILRFRLDENSCLIYKLKQERCELRKKNKKLEKRVEELSGKSQKP